MMGAGLEDILAVPQQAGCWQCCVTGGWGQRWARTDIKRLVALLMAQNQLAAAEKGAFSQDRQMQQAGKLRVRTCAFRDKEQPPGRQLTYIHS